MHWTTPRTNERTHSHIQSAFSSAECMLLKGMDVRLQLSTPFSFSFLLLPFFFLFFPMLPQDKLLSLFLFFLSFSFSLSSPFWSMLFNVAGKERRKGRRRGREREREGRWPKNVILLGYIDRFESSCFTACFLTGLFPVSLRASIVFMYTYRVRSTTSSGFSCASGCQADKGSI